MSYESGTNGIGVGQRYGVREVGNVAGVTSSYSGENRLVFEFDGSDAAALASQTFSIPEGNAMITAAYVAVDAAFTSGTVDVAVDGTGILTLPISLATAGIVDAVIGAVEPITSASVVTVTNPIAAVAAGGGSYAKVIVEITRV